MAEQEFTPGVSNVINFMTWTATTAQKSGFRALTVTAAMEVSHV
jgi:hypothetical protein